LSETRTVSINELVSTVQDLLEKKQAELVSDYLNKITVAPSTLIPYRHFTQEHYTRNLVFKNDLFEMLVLCWGTGHQSWIHNHRGQRCWMKVHEGTLGVRNYVRQGCNQQLRTVGLQPLSESIICDGGIAEVKEEGAVHLVWVPEQSTQPAVSIHIYSQPFDSCVVYDLERGLCRDVSLFYTSEFGVLTNRHIDSGRLADIPPSVCTLGSEGRDSHCGLSKGEKKN
jgi:cysteine dioxygenase